MEQPELEEGEACSFKNHEGDYDASIDPDVDLSYIDEKLQDVLGHFQKDFEGGVFAENLGAKFGGYGSFLPTYQRSPGWGRPRSPPKVHSQNTPRSTAKLQQEGGQGDAVQFSMGTQSLRPVPSSAGSSRLPALKAPSADDGITQENCMTTAGAEALNSKSESLKLTSILDQKTLKFRIKMVPDSLPTRKNAAIYTGLGLDVSPSSSLDDSPSESEGMSCEHRDASFESPASILQMMTSLPMLLSPLTDDHILLTERKTRARESTPVPAHMDKPERSGMLLHESNIVRSDRKSSGGKKKKSMDIKGCIKKNTQNDVGVLSRKEHGIDALNTEEIVSKNLEILPFSNCHSLSGDSVKAVDDTYHTLKDANKGMLREKTSEQVQKGWVEATSIKNGSSERTKGGSGNPAQNRLVEPTSTEVNVRTKGGLGRKVVGDKVSPGDTSVYTEKDNNPERDNMGEPKVSKRRSASNIECKEPPMKPKGRHNTVATEREKHKSKISTFLEPRTKKSSDSSSSSKNEVEETRLQKDLGKAIDTYKDLFGELDEEEDRMDSLEILYGGKLKETKAVKRGTPAINHGAKERLRGDMKVDKPLTSEVYPKKATNVQHTGNLHGADTDNGKGDHVSLPPVVMEDNWVQCDRCHKWRLLPFGTNPDSLPEKWLCSMLNWLPNMNHCSVSEDETTKALITYQAPPPEGQSSLQNASTSVMAGGTLAMAQDPGQYQQNHDLYPVSAANKKITSVTSNPPKMDGSSQFSSSAKKNLPSSVKSRSITNVNISPVVSNTDVMMKKNKSKHKLLEDNPDKGFTKNMKAKSRKGPDQDCPRPFKKSKIDGMHSTDEESIPQSRATRKGGYSSNSSIPTTSAGKDLHRPKDRSSTRDSKYNGNDRLQVSVDTTKDKGQGSLDEGSLNLGNYDSNGGVKKRKLKEYKGSHLQDAYVEKFNDSRKEKKARHSKSEVRESGSSKGIGRTEKKSCHTKKQKLMQNPGRYVSKQRLDGMDCLKMDLGSNAATTSSSSKVSSSHKSKASFQEVKGSPVESVSSSPMRILNQEKFTKRELLEKDAFHDTAAVDSPQRCLDDEDDGGIDRSGTVRKNKSFTMAHYRAHGSAELDFQNKGLNHTSDTISKGQTLLSPGIPTYHVNGGVHAIGQDGTYPGTEQIKGQYHDGNSTGVYHSNVAHPKNIDKKSLLKDSGRRCQSESNAGRVRNTSSPVQLTDKSFPSEAKQYKEGKVKLQEKFGLKSDKSENLQVGKKDYTGNESSKKENQLSRVCDFQEVHINGICNQEALPAPSQNQLAECNAERSSKMSLSERNDQEVGKGKLSFLASGDAIVEPSKVKDALNLQKKQTKKGDYQNGIQQGSSKHPMLNGHRSKELDSPSPIRRDSKGHTANSALKEAKDLKHLADRLKNLGSTHEGTSIYFQAALEFLHGASLLESSNNDSTKHNEMIQSMQIYSSTAKLCEYCAHEYEKSKDMAAAALAYKCMEVAYMRVVYSSNTSASRDRHELQIALQMLPPGESPSSSASDVDNVNNPTTADRIVLSKSTSSPQVAGTHVIAARHRPNIARLLNYVQDVNFAMEASRKSQNAFAAANTSPGEGKHGLGMPSIQKALDFSFQDVEGFLCLARLAMKAIAR